MATAKTLIYFKGLSAGVVAIPLNLVSALGVVWLLSQLLDKAVFGALVFAQAWVLLIGAVSSLGLDRTLIYKVATKDRATDHLVGGGTALGIIIMAAVSASLMALITVFMASAAEIVFAVDGFWFYVFALTLPFSTLSLVVSAWQTANDRAHIAQTLTPIQNLVRLALLTLVFWFAPGSGATAVALIFGSVAMFAASWASIPRGSFAPPELPSADDWRYGFKLLGTGIANEGINRVDLILLGILASPTVVAEFAIAKRLAEVARAGNMLISPIFTPRLRHALMHGDSQALLNEYQQNRMFASGAALVVLLVFFFFGELLLGLFGNYKDAWPILSVMTVAFAVQCLFGANGRYLAMGGHASIGLTFKLAQLLGVVLLTILMVPQMGSVGAAFAILAASLLLNVITARFILWKDEFVTMNVPEVFAVTILLVVPLCWLPHSPVTLEASALALVATIAIVAFRSRQIIGRVVGLVRNTATPGVRRK